MKAERLILRILDGGEADLDAFEAALADRDLPLRGPHGWLLDRAGLLHTVFIGLLRAEARRPASPATRSVFYEPAVQNEKMREACVTFARTHFDDDVDFLLTHRLKGRGGPRRMTEREKRLARAWRGRARIAALATLLDRQGRYRWWGHVFAAINTLAQAVDQYDVAYVTKPWDRRCYCIATFLQRHTRAEVRLVYQSMPLYGNQRRLHVPVTAVVTSRVNVPEAEYFRAAGEFRAAAIVYRAGFFVAEREAYVPSDPVYDLGFFASGDWAREDGLYRARDIERVRAGAYRDNVYERYAENVLEALAEYATSRRRTLRIYLHPYERTLLHEHGIEPPYRGLADGRYVTIDDRPGDSRHAFYEVDVAVALRSSTIWQRLDLGLERSFMYAFEDPALGNMLPESLGEYQRNVFTSADDLFAKLDACFTAGAGAAGRGAASS